MRPPRRPRPKKSPRRRAGPRTLVRIVRANTRSTRPTRRTRPNGTNTSKTRGGGTRKLLPVLRPSQNMRDIIKQLALLEDHLYHPQKRCPDCIRKHFLTIEGLAEECATLCKPRAILPESRKVATVSRVLHHAWEARPKDPAVAEHVAGKLRRLRKGLMRTFAALPLDKLPTRETNAVNALLGSVRRARANARARVNARAPVNAR